MTVRQLLGGAALAASILFVAGGANAQSSLDPGAFVAPPTVAIPVAGSTLLQSSSSAFAGVSLSGETLSGVLRSSVFRTTGGTLDFFYQIVNAPGSTANISAFSVSSFRGAATFVGQNSNDIDGAGAFTAGTFASTLVQREGLPGDALTFTFGTTITPGGTSWAQLVSTSATDFSPTGSAGILGGGVAANTAATVIAPISTQAPEPGSLALVATGLMGAMGMVARRRRSAK